MSNLQSLIDKSKEYQDFHKERIAFLNKHFDRCRMEWAVVGVSKSFLLCEDLLLEDTIQVSFDTLYNYLIEFETLPDDTPFEEYIQYIYCNNKAILADWCLYAHLLPHLDYMFQEYWNGKTKDYICFESLIKTIEANNPNQTQNKFPEPKES